MLLLNKSEYTKLREPLKRVTINHLFARSVVEGYVDGHVYVDDARDPGTFYVVHPYGMSLLFGETCNTDFNTRLRDYILNIQKVRQEYEWLQAFPDAWNIKLSELLGEKLIKYIYNIGNADNDKIEVCTRVNFKFNKNKYVELKLGIVPRHFKILRTDKRMFANMQGTVVPKYFWKNADHFDKSGVGFSLIVENKVVSTAYSSFIHENQLELGIETLESYRGNGFAIYTCSTLIDYCLMNNYEPIWACRLENTGSYKLAQKLGFEPTIQIPYYRLNY